LPYYCWLTSRSFDMLMKAGRLGEKSGAGFYLHQQGKATPHPELAAMLTTARAAAGIAQPVGSSSSSCAL
jgi:3-hydroxyacyl-CoA dehydrogenase